MNEPGLQRQTTADGVDTFYSVQYQQTFHSKYGALLEADHVFLKAAGPPGKREMLVATQ